MNVNGKWGYYVLKRWIACKIMAPEWAKASAEARCLVQHLHAVVSGKKLGQWDLFWLVVTGTRLWFSHILGIIIPIETFLFFRGVAQPPTSLGIFWIDMPWLSPHLSGQPLGEVSQWLKPPAWRKMVVVRVKRIVETIWMHLNSYQNIVDTSCYETTGMYNKHRKHLFFSASSFSSQRT